MFILREHKGTVVFTGNTITDSITYSGAISVVQQEGAFWLASNSFVRNVALLGSNAISLHMGATTVEGSTTEKQCGAINISSNTFTHNIGCQDTTGAIALNCVADTNWSYNSIMDQYTYKEDEALPVYDTTYFTIQETESSTSSVI